MPLTAEEKRQNRIAKVEQRFKALMLGKCKGETARAFQKMRRLQCADRHGMVMCCTCSGAYHWKTIDGGHYIGRKHTATLFEPTNVHGQCKYCNDPKNGAASAGKYAAFIGRRYGSAEVIRLEQLAKTTRTFTRLELAEMLVDYQAEIRNLEKELACY